MSEREDQESQEAQESQEGEAQRADVQGVDTDPDDGDKSIAVDTNERLEGRDDERDFDDIPDEELEEERQKRLDPDNRPDNVEVDNSKRDFDPKTGLFEDSDVEPPEEAPFSTTEAEESNTSEAKDSDDDSHEDSDESTDAEQSEDAKG